MRGKEAVRQAFLRGFYTEAAVFPVCAAGEEPGTIIEVNADKRRPAARGERNGKEPAGEFLAASDAPGILPEADWRQKKGLEKLFAPGLFLKDQDQDGLADALELVICIPETADSALLAAACNFAFRFGMETTGYQGCLVRYIEEGIPEDQNVLLFEEGDRCGIYYEPAEAGSEVCRVRVAGRGRELEAFAARLCGEFPLQPEGRDWETVLRELTDAFCARNEDGELLAAAVAAEGKQHADAFVSPRLAARAEALAAQVPQISFHNAKEGKQVFEKNWDLPWEKEVLETLLEEKVYPRLKEGDVLCVQAAISEEEAVRGGVQASILAQAEAHGAGTEECRVLCAYKQGYSWIREAVLPLLEGKGAVRMEIAFRPFLPAGVQEQDEENGALPSYNNIGAGDPDAWYDLSIRPLQELYPIRDEIQKRLGMDRDSVLFSRYEGPEDLTYVCRAWDARGREIFQDKYRAAYAERSFLDAFPEMGKVHPCTGYIRAFINGESVLDERIPTDLERIWEVFQGSVLEECRKYVEAKYPQGVTPKDQPLFSRLVLEAEVSEPDERLDSREDLFSSLDAFHEDLYFVGSDYFKNYGLKSSGNVLDAPGLILPLVRKREGKPSFRAALYDRAAEGFCVKTEDGVFGAPCRREEVGLFLESVTREGGRTVATLQTDAPAVYVERLAELMSRGLTETGNALAGVDVLRFRVPEETDVFKGETNVFEGKTSVFEAEIRRWQEPVKDLAITEIDLMEDRVIGYDDYMEMIRQLRRVPGISVDRTAVSYEGREIYAVSLLPKAEGYVSRTKRLAAHPSMIVNARHHANEVSSTNASLLLLKKLLTEKQYEDLTDRLDLVLVPMENVDGAALHYELQKEHPCWKLHVARFNAVGKEFYYDYFHDDTIHTEALGFTKLWRKLLPDVVIDDHGVPTHEWEQQFSGYTSPSYKGFWLPRSLLYGYFWYVTDPQYRSSYELNRALEERIADAVGADPEMARWNQEWADQFETYAHAWMPGLFPADYYKGMINYWIPFAYDPEHRYPSIRFPWITTVAYTSEVADETAQGAYLNLCARTHVVHDEAAIRMMTENRICVMEDTCQTDGEYLALKLLRRRPVVIET